MKLSAVFGSLVLVAVASTGPAAPGGLARGQVALAAPSCTTAVDLGPQLTDLHPSYSKTDAAPWGVAVSPKSNAAYVATSDYVEEYKPAVPTPRDPKPIGPGGDGMAITPDGRFLLVTTLGDGAETIPTTPSRQTASMDTLSTDTLSGAPGSTATEVAVTPDGHFAFIALEYSSAVAVYRLHEGKTTLTGSYVGEVPVGGAAVGLAVSPNGKWLYSTSETGGPGGTDHGSLRVISVAQAEHHPAHSVRAIVGAGCEPVRVATSANGAYVWVTARASDALLAYSTARLLNEPSKALVADVRVGEAPVGLAVANGGKNIVVADSNRFSTAKQTANLVIVNVRAALAGQPAVLGHVGSGSFPRDMATTSNGHDVFVTNFQSNELEKIDTADLELSAGNSDG